MLYMIELKAPAVSITAIIDANRWPRKRANDMAREALRHLAQGVAAAIEATPYVGIERAQVSVGPVSCGRDTFPPEKPVAATVGPPTWESLEAKVKAVQLPEGVALVNTADDPAVTDVRISDDARTAIVWLAEDRVQDGVHPIEVGSVELDFELEADEVESRLMGAAKAILEAVELRDTPQGVPDEE